MARDGPLPPVRRRRAGRRSKRRMAPCRNGIQTVAAWISKIPRNHEPTPGWQELGREGPEGGGTCVPKPVAHAWYAVSCVPEAMGRLHTGLLNSQRRKSLKGGTCAFRSKAHHRGYGNSIKRITSYENSFSSVENFMYYSYYRYFN